MPDLKMLITDENTGRLRVGMPRPPQLVEGIDLLVQIVVLLYLNNGGRSIFCPGRSGGLREYIGLNHDPEDPSELFADLRLMTSQIEQTIKEEQVLTARPPSERLLALRVIDVLPDETLTEIDLQVQVINEEQQTEQAVVAL